MKIKNKGIVYSLITLLLVAPVLLYLIAYMDAAGKRDELSSLKIRGLELSNYANSISQDVPRIFKITSKRALISAVNEMDINGTALDDAQRRILELMLNGTIYGQNSTFMSASSLRDWAGRMASAGNRLGLATTISFSYLNVTPYDSFNLEFSMLLFVNATDGEGTVSIIRAYNESFILNLVGFEDALFPLNTNGFVKRQIRRANYSVYGSYSVDQAIADQVYLNTSEGGSYLDRMEGKDYLQAKYALQSPRQIGLESFANLQKIGAAGVPTKDNQTVIDHLYFNNSIFTGCTVQNSSYSWFKLDAAHASAYGVTIAAC